MKTISVSLSLALVLISPGWLPYQAFGQVVQISVQIPTSNPGIVPVTGRGLSLAAPSSSLRSADIKAGTVLPDLGSALPVVSQDLEVPGGLSGSVLAAPDAYDVAVPLAETPQQAVAVAPVSSPLTQATPTVLSEAGPSAVPQAKTDALAEGVLAGAPQGQIASAAKSKGLARHFKALWSLFSGRKVEALPTDGSQVDASRGEASPESAAYRLASPSQAPPEEEKASALETPLVPAVPLPGSAVEAPKQDAPKASSWLGLGKVAVFFILALIFGQIGIEALGAALPALIEKSFGDVTKMAEITIFASATNIIGRTIGTIAVRRFGLKKTYLGATALRVLSVSGLAALLATGTMTWPLMIAFYSLNGFLGGIAMTAEFSIPPAIYGSDQVKLEKFWTWQQTLLEIVGVTGPIATGAVVASMGFLPALVAFPISFVVALAIMFFTLKIPAKVAAMKLADAQAKASGNKDAPQGVGGAFKEFFGKMARGARVVWNDPLLRAAFLAFTAFMILNPMLYTMMAPGFGMRLLGPANENLYTSVIGMLTGLYSLGGLLGGFMMMAEQKKIGRLPISDADERELLRRSMLRWMKWGTVGLAAIATMAFPVPMLGALVALPSWLAWLGALTLPAVALIPFGIAQVVSTVKLKSYFQSKTRAEDMTDAMGFFGSASLAVSTAAILALKFLFKGFAGFTPFVVIAAAMIPLAVYYLYLTRRLDKLSATDKR
ncbi:MAG: hypothetical protein HY748_17730 [Elusimicrobia bacterium]|nr:hypothetical protein [Elusimicrobiota bacterium]